MSEEAAHLITGSCCKAWGESRAKSNLAHPTAPEVVVSTSPCAAADGHRGQLAWCERRLRRVREAEEGWKDDWGRLQ